MESILEKIHRATLKFLTPLTPDETYTIVGQEAQKLVGGEHSTIYLLEDRELVRAYSSLPSLFRISGKERDIRYDVIKNKKPAILSLSFMKKLKKKYPFMGKVYNRSALMIPLSYKHETIGLLSVLALKNTDFTEDKLEILTLFGSLASLAIKKNQLYDETKKALEVRDLFIAMAAHELRTPLTSVNGYIQLLYSKLSGAETPESRWIEQLYWEGNRLTNLVNELLEMNRIKSGKLSYYLRECSLREIFSRLEKNFLMLHPDRKLIIQDEIGKSSDIVIGDYEKITQVFSNLIDNAAKFSPEHSPVKVIIKQDDNDFIIRIVDQGKGIPQKDINKVFQGFYRGKEQTEEGMGMGLFLVKDIVSRLHGNIRIESKLGGGTVVEVKLPKQNL